MRRVGNAGKAKNSNRPRKEKRLTYVFDNADDTKHCAGINCLSLLKSAPSDGFDYLFTGSRDGRLKRWALVDDKPSFSATFKSHVDWVNDVVLLSDDVLVSCSSDNTIKTWNALSNGTCTRTLRQHTDYVTCLATTEKNNTVVASGGLGGEVFIWDIEAAKCNYTMGGDSSNGANASSMDTAQTKYTPIVAKGHKESVYAMAMNEGGTLLVSGGTEMVVRVWDPRSGSKTLKLKGHTDNIRALLLDSTGRFCVSGSSDSMIRLWDIGQQRCIHSYAVHTDSVWALASTSTLSHVYSGGRDLSVYLTDLQTRESALLCTEENPILHLALHDDNIWVTSTDSSVHRWNAEGRNPQKIFQRINSLLTGNLSLPRARVSLEESTPVPVYKQPTLTIHGIPAIVQNAILNNRRHVLTKDTSGSVKLWEITKGALVEDYGNVSFEEKKEEDMFEGNIPAWFTVDTRLGCLSVHFDCPQCFIAEMSSEDLNIEGKPKDDKVNLGQETLKGLFADWLRKRKQRMECAASSNGELLTGKDIGIRSHTPSIFDGSSEINAEVYPPFQFSDISTLIIITEGTRPGSWGKKITHLDGTEDEKDFPRWFLQCLLNNCLPSSSSNENPKNV